MAKTPKGKKAAKTAVEAKAPKTPKAPKAPKEPKPLSQRQLAFQEKHAPAVKLAKGIKVMEHNRGMYFIMLGTNAYVVGTLSETGKSFNVDFEGTHDEALAFYRKERSGKYGKGEGTPAPKASKKGAKAPAKKSKKKAAAVEADDDLDDLTD